MPSPYTAATSIVVAILAFVVVPSNVVPAWIVIEGRRIAPEAGGVAVDHRPAATEHLLRPIHNRPISQSLAWIVMPVAETAWHRDRRPQLMRDYRCSAIVVGFCGLK
jgi:hypothetical protein